MTLPRPQFIVLLVVAVFAAGFLYMKNSGTPGEPGTSSPSSGSKSTKSSPATNAGSSEGQASTKESSPTSKSSASSSDASGVSETGKTSLPGSPTSVTPAVAKAMLDHKVVVVYFGSNAALEDRQVEREVDAIRAGPGVAVIKDTPRAIARYSFVANNVTQTPAVVVIDRNYRTRSVQGFVERATLAQMIVEASR